MTISDLARCHEMELPDGGQAITGLSFCDFCQVGQSFVQCLRLHTGDRVDIKRLVDPSLGGRLSFSAYSSGEHFFALPPSSLQQSLEL
jgi:hypothetical protein